MRKGLGALVVGLIGGALAAVVILYVVKPPGDGAISASGDLRGNPAVLERLDRIEALLEQRGLLTARLEGRAEGPDGTAPGARGEAAARLEAGIAERVDEVLQEKVKPYVDTAVQEKWDELQAKKDDDEQPGRRGRRRMALADVAREVGLSAREEDDLRRIFANAENKLYELFAKPDGDVEQVKRDLEAFKTDPTARPQLMGKYVPKMLKNIGEVMAIEQEKNAAVVEAVGEERAAELSGYNIEEANPLDMNAEMRVEARDGR